MKCPYCAEEIKDEAIVCRYCGRDLVLLKPILGRLDSLEEELSTLNTSFEQERRRLDLAVESFQSGVSGSPTRPVRKDDFSWFYAILILLPAIAYFHIFYILADQEFDTFQVILFFSPILFGLWLGHQWRGSHLAAYALSGLIIGVVGTVGDWIAFGYLDSEIAVVVIPVAILLFTTGGITGDWIERRRYGRPDSDGYSEKLAKRLVELRTKTPGESEGASEDRIKTLSDLIAALTPILTFIASVIATIVTYLVAVQGGKGG